MDLDANTPIDRARRWAILSAANVAVFVLGLVWLALAWPWYLVILAPVAVYLLLFPVAFAVFRRFIRY